MQLKDERPPVSAQPFYQHVIIYFWPLMYFCLGTLIIILRPPFPKRTKAFDLRQTLQIAIMAAIVSVFATGPLIVRNLYALRHSEFRTVYAYSNLDVDPPSFICQIVNFLIFSALISILWNQWMRYSVVIRSQVTARDFGSGLEGAFDPDTLDQLSTELIRSQTCLAVLSIGFIGYTAIFWKQVIQNGDPRYVLEGFIAHAFWVISAVLMAMPFWVMWRAWRLSRIRALGELIQMPASEAVSLEARITALRELRPVGAWNLAAFVATAASALAAPAIQLIFKLAHLA